MLTEAQRVSAIGISSVPGGDTVAMRLDCEPGALKDVASNPSLTSNDVAVEYIEVSTKPAAVDAEVYIASSNNGTYKHLNRARHLSRIGAENDSIKKVYYSFLY